MKPDAPERDGELERKPRTTIKEENTRRTTEEWRESPDATPSNLKKEENPLADKVARLETRPTRIKSELAELDQDRQLRRSRESSLTPRKRRRSPSQGDKPP